MKMTSLSRYLRGILYSLSLTALFSGTGFTQDATPDLSGTTIIVGQNNYDLEPGMIGSGVLEGTPYKVQFATFPNGDATLTALSTGSIDITLQSLFGAIKSQAAAKPAWTAEDIPYKAVISAWDSADRKNFEPFVTIASKKSGITTLGAEAVKGKKWAATPGGTSFYSQLAAIKSLGLTKPDVNLVSLNQTDASVALLNGDVDLASGLIHQYQDAITDGAKVIGSAADYDGDVPSALFANTTSLKDEKKEAALQDFIRRYVLFLGWWSAQPEAAQASLIKARKLSPTTAKTNWLYSRREILTIDDNLKKVAARIADTAHQFGVFSTAVDTSLLFDDRFNATTIKTLSDSDYPGILQRALKIN